MPFCDELQSAQPFKIQPLCLAIFSSHTIQILYFNTRVELNMCFTFVVIVVEYARRDKGEIKRRRGIDWLLVYGLGCCCSVYVLGYKLDQK